MIAGEEARLGGIGHLALHIVSSLFDTFQLHAN